MAQERYMEALDKLRDEMAKEAKNPGIQYLGQWLTRELERNAGAAEKILAEGKTLKGAFDAIRKYAEKNRTGNFAFVPPEKGIDLAADYYGLGKQETQALGEPAKSSSSFDLDELLEGL